MNSFPASTLITDAIFGFCLATMVAGAGVAVFSSRLIRSVCGLAICCFGLAGLYYFLQSPFLALMEILIYVGAVCVTIVFAVMLAEPDDAPRLEKPAAALWWGGCALLACLVAFWGISHLGLNHPWTTPVTQVNQGTVKAIGISLLTTYSLAFELVSVVLLISVLGALVIAGTGRGEH